MVDRACAVANVTTNKYVGPPYCWAEMYAGRVACSRYANGTDRHTDGRTDDRPLHYASCGQCNKGELLLLILWLAKIVLNVMCTSWRLHSSMHLSTESGLVEHDMWNMQHTWTWTCRGVRGYDPPSWPLYWRRLRKTVKGSRVSTDTDSSPMVRYRTEAED